MSANDTVKATAGSLVIQSGSSIVVQSGTTVTATGGNLSVSISGAPVNACPDTGGEPGPACRPAGANNHVYVENRSSKLYWPSIVGDMKAPLASNISVSNSRTLGFNASANDAITINSGAIFTAN